MNSTARALAKAQFSVEGALPFLTSRQFWLTCFLAGIVLLSALSVIYTKDLTRRTFIEVQNLKSSADQMHIQWGKLLLEESSWSTARIQRLAQRQLSMQTPRLRQIVVVH